MGGLFSHTTEDLPAKHAKGREKRRYVPASSANERGIRFQVICVA